MISKNRVIKLYPTENEDFEDLFFALTKGRGCDLGITYFFRNRGERQSGINKWMLALKTREEGGF